jgi:hypothetical protein
VNPPLAAGVRCDACARERARLLFLFRTRAGSVVKCGRCALRHPPLLKRSLGIAAIVGTVLLAINQGDVLLSTRWPSALAWKVPLTYYSRASAGGAPAPRRPAARTTLVPFLVATWGALLNSRVPGP